VRHAARLLTKQELTRQLLALVLTAVLVWHTVLIPANASAPAKRPRRRSPSDEERSAESRRGEVYSNALKDTDESVDEMDWPEFIGLD